MTGASSPTPASLSSVMLVPMYVFVCYSPPSQDFTTNEAVHLQASSVRIPFPSLLSLYLSAPFSCSVPLAQERSVQRKVPSVLHLRLGAACSVPSPHVGASSHSCVGPGWSTRCLPSCAPDVHHVLASIHVLSRGRPPGQDCTWWGAGPRRVSVFRLRALRIGGPSSHVSTSSLCGAALWEKKRERF